MKVVTTRAELAAERARLSGSVGFVPTMGYLHDGHLSLVRAAAAGNEHVIVSIFVNPTQFGPSEDLDAYPRDLDHDLALLEAAGVDVVWTPGVEDVYPPGSSTRVTVGGPSLVLEGASRPGHFDGVATVCTILFSCVRPDDAYFGQKDAQQCVVLRHVVRDLGLPLRLHVEPIRREADGLAMSSRNVYLTPAQRSAAPALRRSLDALEAAWAASENDAEALKATVLAVLDEQHEGDVEYVSIADPDTLAEVDDVRGGALVSMVVRFGRTRLLDNTILPAR